MFGYAVNETDNYMPLALDISHKIMIELGILRKEKNEIKYLRPDAKSQVTIEYDENNKPLRISTIVISTQHDDFGTEKKMLTKIKSDIIRYLIPRVLRHYPKHITKLFDDNINYLINPTGKFVIGGPHGDTGLPGRKIVVDTYGGKGAHGGGAFSGKDPSKVDRSAAYAARHIAKNLVASGVCDEVLVQISFAIGVEHPTSIFVNTYNTSNSNFSDSEIANKLSENIDLSPYAIEKRFKLRNPIYSETSSYGHMGRQPQKVVKTFFSKYNGNKSIEVELFTWEKLDLVKKLKKMFL